MFECVNCSQPVSKERWQEGYHYCFSVECYNACFDRPRIVFEAVNKAAYQIQIAPPIVIDAATPKDPTAGTEPESKKTKQKFSHGIQNPIFKRRDITLKQLEELDKWLESKSDLSCEASDEYVQRKTQIITSWNNYVRLSNIRYRSWTIYEGTELDQGFRQKHSLR